MRSSVRQELLALYKTIVLESHLHQVFSKQSTLRLAGCSLVYSSGVLQQLINTADGPSRETTGVLLQMIDDITPGLSEDHRTALLRICFA